MGRRLNFRMDKVSLVLKVSCWGSKFDRGRGRMPKVDNNT